MGRALSYSTYPAGKVGAFAWMDINLIKWNVSMGPPRASIELTLCQYGQLGLFHEFRNDAVSFPWISESRGLFWLMTL